MKIERLDWDSDLFGYEVGKISIEPKDNFFNDISIVNKDFKLFYIESDLPLEKEGFELCYKKITYSKKIGYNKFLSLDDENLTIEQYSGCLTDHLLNLTYQSGVYSRFRLDANFKNNEYKKLYNIWIKKSLNGKIADTVQVIKDKNSMIRGFVTIKFKETYSEIGLIAVDSNTRGLGIGSILLNRVDELSRDQGYNKVYVSTQKDNKPACRFYEKNGYKEFKTKYIYHWWTNK